MLAEQHSPYSIPINFRPVQCTVFHELGEAFAQNIC